MHPRHGGTRRAFNDSGGGATLARLFEQRLGLLRRHGIAKGTTVFHVRATPERLTAFCDGLFAVLITVLVLDLRPPALPTFKALLSLWPTWISYAVSYLFIAIVWANHHYLMRYATEVTPRLIWFNFAHLFSVSLLPLSTAWMAVSELAPQPVAFYAAVFFLVNATYIFLIRELIDRTPSKDISPTARRIMRARSIATLCLFGMASVVALKYPLVGLGICCCCLIVYLKPEAPGASADHLSQIGRSNPRH
jgi:TMEM175 potassium channel family protein